MKVGFIGLGRMGQGMAGRVLATGNDLAVYNRTLKKAERWADEYGGRIAATPRIKTNGRR